MAWVPLLQMSVCMWRGSTSISYIRSRVFHCQIIYSTTSNAGVKATCASRHGFSVCTMASMNSQVRSALPVVSVCIARVWHAERPVIEWQSLVTAMCLLVNSHSSIGKQQVIWSPLGKYRSSCSDKWYISTVEAVQWTNMTGIAVRSFTGQVVGNTLMRCQVL